MQMNMHTECLIMLNGLVRADDSNLYGSTVN